MSNNIEDWTAHAPLQACASNSEQMKYSKILINLQQILQHDINACDAKFTLFAAAAQSPEREQLLDPIPSMFVNADNKCDFDGLLETINATPKLNILLHQLKAKKYSECNVRVINLLHWLLWEKFAPRLASVDEQEVQKIIKFIENYKVSVMPTNIFEICYETRSEEEQIFQTRGKEYNLDYAVCSYKMDKYYKVLYNGFLNWKKKQRSSKASEESLQLAKNISLDLKQCGIQTCWNNSSFGNELRCVTLCQYICRPEYVSYSNESNWPAVSIVLGEIVRPRYLMFFATNPTSLSPITDVPLTNEFIIDDITTTSEDELIPKASAKHERAYFYTGLTVFAVAAGFYAYNKNIFGLKDLLNSNVKGAFKMCSNIFNKLI